MREATQEEREGVEMYIDSIADIAPSKWMAENLCDDCISRQAAIDLADELKDNLPDDDHLSDMIMSHNEGILEYQTKLSLLPSVLPKQTECEDCCNGNQEVKAKLCQKSYLAGMEHRMEQNPCEDCISRKAVLDALEKWWSCKSENDDIYEIIKALTSVTPAEKVGRWISFGIQGEIDGQIVRAFTCSKCGAISIFRMASGNIVNGDLCPNCGAMMQEVEE